MQLSIFPIKEFKTWVAMPNKTYPMLEAFVHKAYMWGLMESTLGNITGQLGYVAHQNMYSILDSNIINKDMDNNATTVIQTAAADTTGSTLGSTCPTPLQPFQLKLPW
jgi:hypothetical protein